MLLFNNFNINNILSTVFNFNSSGDWSFGQLLIGIFLKQTIITTILLFFILRSTMSYVFNLIFLFVVSAIFFIYFKADFLGFLLMIVYVGAVAVLFIFVIMMVNLGDNSIKINTTAQFYYFFGVFSTIIVCVTVIEKYINSGIFKNSYIDSEYLGSVFSINKFNDNSVIFDIGSLLYVDYSLAFLIIAFVLLVAMVGAIQLVQDFQDDRNMFISYTFDNTSNIFNNNDIQSFQLTFNYQFRKLDGFVALTEILQNIKILTKGSFTYSIVITQGLGNDYGEFYEFFKEYISIQCRRFRVLFPRLESGTFQFTKYNIKYKLSYK